MHRLFVFALVCGLFIASSFTPVPAQAQPICNVMWAAKSADAYLQKRLGVSYNIRNITASVREEAGSYIFSIFNWAEQEASCMASVEVQGRSCEVIVEHSSPGWECDR